MKLTSNKIILFTCFLILLHINVIAQIEGLWIVKKVLVGNEVMTPVAKWVKLEAGGTQLSGNGWLQHTFGTWNYDTSTSELSLFSEPGPVDEFGAFKVKYQGQHMTWERMEEGEKILVELERTEALPRSSADEMQGVWDLEKVTKQNEDITNQFDPEGKAYIFIRWDRIYVERTAGGERATGFWYINAHRPDLQLISYDKNIKDQTWRISFSDSKMTWTGLDEKNKNLVLTYERIKNFPK
ncbi:MAG: hypothetical protein IPJ74_19060 [Saprospiraceae bacterium]|nr:hypothetical protein [Saprospiraceae bacterium]